MKVNPKLVVSKPLYSEALKAVNAVRKLAGRKALTSLPAGIPGDEVACPLFYALKDLGVDAVGHSGDVSGDINVKGGTYDLSNDGFTGFIKIGENRIPVEDMKVSIEEIEHLRDVAADFVDEFDDRGEAYISDRTERE